MNVVWAWHGFVQSIMGSGHFPDLNEVQYALGLDIKFDVEKVVESHSMLDMFCKPGIP